jgi:hypothetical protein
MDPMKHQQKGRQMARKTSQRFVNQPREQLTMRDKERLRELLQDEYDRIDRMATQEGFDDFGNPAGGFTLGAKIASLADITLLARKLDVVVERSSRKGTKRA